jgi:hypothetical protein
MAKRLKITRTLVSTSETPFNNDYYPNMSIEEAVAYEKSAEDGEWEENLFDTDLTVETSVEILED